jgi:hypothetical protein
VAVVNFRQFDYPQWAPIGILMHSGDEYSNLSILVHKVAPANLPWVVQQIHVRLDQELAGKWTQSENPGKWSQKELRKKDAEINLMQVQNEIIQYVCGEYGIEKKEEETKKEGETKKEEEEEKKKKEEVPSVPQVFASPLSCHPLDQKVDKFMAKWTSSQQLLAKFCRRCLTDSQRPNLQNRKKHAGSH